jgi:hypothetical protein
MFRDVLSTGWQSFRHWAPGLASLNAGLLCCGSLFAADLPVAADQAVADKVAGHLAAGEFGRAADVAEAQAPSSGLATLLQQVAAAQDQSGIPQAARATRRRAQLAQPQGRPLAGGVGAAGMQELATLIMENTGGPGVGEWEEDGGLGTISQYPAGVKVAPDGLLSRATQVDGAGQLAPLAAQARQAAVNADLAQPSDFRVISLKALEAAVAERLASGQPVPASMAYLGGLTNVRYVFFDDASHDVLLAGAAERWEYRADGIAVGVNSGRPVLMLDDFVTIWRTFENGASDFGCSIETRESGVKAVQQYAAASQQRGPLSAGNGVKNFVSQLQKKLGRQDIVFWGLPADSHVARVIIAADYRMKLIGVEKLQPGVDIPSYFDLLPAGAAGAAAPMEALRWWLTMSCDAVVHSPDRQAFEIQGSSVKCQSENQFLTDEGQRVATGHAEATNRAFAEAFTRRFAELAQKDLVFAQTQQVFDLALVVALIRQEQSANADKWNAGAFAAGGMYRTVRYAAPTEVESVVNHRVYNGRDVVIQVAGGVRANVADTVGNPEVVRSAETLPTEVATTRPQGLPASRWWWDSAR